MKTQLAFYKGPPEDLIHKVSHALTCWWTGSKYSHIELVIDGLSYSSSGRDHGVRAKEIDYSTGRWDIEDLPSEFIDVPFVLRFYEKTKDNEYDYRGLVYFVIQKVKHYLNRWFCSEWVGRALKLAATQKLHIQDLYEWLNDRKLEYAEYAKYKP